jgi:outer membrane receptor protein involved in Fe transport
MRCPVASLAICALAIAQLPLSSQTVHLAPHVVTASRAPQAPEHVAASMTVFDGDAIRRAPVATLDGALRSQPGFSLFRRSDSFTAHPTAQGVSLRGLGPSGASRSLILLDGVPLNDPFGGWVIWTKVPRESLSHIELVPGGGATAWGNAALGGVVQLLDRPAGRSPNRAAVLAGDYGTRSLEFSAAHHMDRDTIHLRARDFATDGFRLVAPEHRGPVDIAAWSRHRWASAGWHRAFSPEFQLGASVRLFEEKRGNGTPLQQNSSREKFASFHAAGQPGTNFSWNATGYVQDQSFASSFSAVNATRSAETPASDQYDVPADAIGAAWTGIWNRDDSRTSFGADFRRVTGETREHFTFSNGAFTRQRVAGGEQGVAGLFFLRDQPFTHALRATLGARFDAWRETGGHRRENDLVGGDVLRDDRYADREGTAFSPSFGLVWRPDENWRLRASFQRAFRRPTLNELYRPFRVGPNVTEANAALRTERVNSGELGAEWTLRAPPAPGRSLLTLGAVAFWNDLRDAVGNVTLARGPGAFPIVGFIPAGGVGRQRLNLERTRVQGLELSARWQPMRAATFSGEYLYNDATVRRSARAPGLVGKRIAQVPRHSAALGATLEPGLGFIVTPRVRWLDRQFEDDENALILGEVVVADLGVSRAFGEHLELFLNVENLGNVRIETGRTAGGLVNTGMPRLAMLGVRAAW